LVAGRKRVPHRRRGRRLFERASNLDRWGDVGRSSIRGGSVPTASRSVRAARTSVANARTTAVKAPGRSRFERWRRRG
jgi:hypothetical protein